MFVAFDGIDGSGKTSQVELLKKKLSAKGFSCTAYDMGHEGFMDDIFAGIKTKKYHCDAEIRELLYYFEGVLFGQSVARPNLGTPTKVILVDRYILSFLSYGPLNGIPQDRIRFLTDSMPWPDLYFYMDIKPKTAITRISRYRRVDLPEIGFKNKLSSNEQDQSATFPNSPGKSPSEFLKCN